MLLGQIRVNISQCKSARLFDNCAGEDNGVINFFSEKSGSQMILMLVLRGLLPVKLICTFRMVA